MGLVIIPCRETNWLIQPEQAQLLNWSRTQGKETTAAGQEAAALTGGPPVVVTTEQLVPCSYNSK